MDRTGQDRTGQNRIEYRLRGKYKNIRNEIQEIGSKLDKIK